MSTRKQIEEGTPNRLYFYHSKENPRVTIAGTYVDGHLYLGAARCSRKDQFCKKKGRYISAGRAIKAMEEEVNCIPANIIQQLKMEESPGAFFVSVAKGTAKIIAQTCDLKSFAINIEQ